MVVFSPYLSRDQLGTRSSGVLTREVSPRVPDLTYPNHWPIILNNFFLCGYIKWLEMLPTASLYKIIYVKPLPHEKLFLYMLLSILKTVITYLSWVTFFLKSSPTSWLHHYSLYSMYSYPCLSVCLSRYYFYLFPSSGAVDALLIASIWSHVPAEKSNHYIQNDYINTWLMLVTCHNIKCTKQYKSSVNTNNKNNHSSKSVD